MRIVIEGNDGTGKTTLCQALKALGIENVQDRGEMSAATLSDLVEPMPDTLYILLDCPWDVSKSRLIAAGKDMAEKWHSDNSLVYYRQAFLDLAPRFRAHIIPQQKKLDVLRHALRLIGAQLRVGLAYGRLAECDLSQLPGFFRMEPSEANRTLFQDLGPITFLRSKDYVKMVALSALDSAVVGSDSMEGNPFADAVRVVMSVPQVGQEGHPIRMCLSTPSGVLPQKSLLRVATPFPAWAAKVFGERGIPHTIFHVSGGSEGLIRADVADVLMDIVETGRSLSENGLQVAEDLGTLSAQVIVRK